MCLFCDIVAGDTSAEIVLETDHAVAFLDSRPVFKGHTLVVPRRHVDTLLDLPADLAQPLVAATQRVADAMSVLGAQGTFVAMNNVVSQSVPHLHVHVVPRQKGDGLRGFFWPRTTYADGEAAEYGDLLRSSLAEHKSITAFRAALREAGGAGRIVVLPDSVHTAALAAAALGCEVGAIANSLLFDAVGEPILILTSGAHRVDVDKAAAAIGVPSLRRAKPDFVREHTGQVIGGVSPIAHPRPIRRYLDPALRRYDEIWAAAGHPAAVFSTTYAELQAMTGAEEIAVS